MTDTGSLRWHNPLSVPSRSVKAGHFGGGSISYTFSAGSTTDTVNYTSRGGPILTIPSRKLELVIPTLQLFKHTVANALFELSCRIYTTEDTTTTLSTERLVNLTLPAVAGQWALFTPTFIFDLDFIGAAPGRHLVLFIVGPITAGTLSWGEPSSSEGFVATLVAQGLRTQ